MRSFPVVVAGFDLVRNRNRWAGPFLLVALLGMELITTGVKDLAARAAHAARRSSAVRSFDVAAPILGATVSHAMLAATTGRARSAALALRQSSCARP